MIYIAWVQLWWHNMNQVVQCTIFVHYALAMHKHVAAPSPLLLARLVAVTGGLHETGLPIQINDGVLISVYNH